MWSARYQREQDKCSQCTNPREKCSDPDHDWFPQMIVCHATMEQMAAQRRWDALHDTESGEWHDGTFENWATDRSRSHPYHRSDGTQIVVSPVDFGLGGDFLRLGAAEAIPSDADGEDLRQP